MRVYRAGIVVGFAIALAVSVGCVDRRFVVTSNVPGAHITVDGEAIGPTPADAAYTYAGKREFRATAPGYDSLVEIVNFEPKWFDIPGLDLFAEVFWPFQIQDVRRVNLLLQPIRAIPVEQIQSDAEGLRARGLNLPPPSVPNDLPGTQGIPDPRAGNITPRTGSTPIPPIVPGRFNSGR